jgi:hypothetical protein
MRCDVKTARRRARWKRMEDDEVSTTPRHLHWYSLVEAGSANQSYQPSHRGINHRGIGTMFDIATISHLPAIDSTDFL